jgi:hypothetical protein
VPGDTIVLDAGVTYNGYFTLPAKSNPNGKWIYIISSAIANLPAGTRVSPSVSQYMAKIVTPNVAPALQVNSGANHYRIAGLELTAQSSYPAGCGVTGQPNCMTYFLMSTPWPIATEPDSITIDRCYLHGGPTQDLQAAMQANWSTVGVVDSYINDVHDKGAEAQAIGAFHTPGPFKITNNYLSAATQSIMFGGSGGANNTSVPSDITITGNYLYKPLSWIAPSTSSSPTMVVKNAFELKDAQRVLFDSNVIENVWRAGQAGYAIVLTVRSSQSGDLAVVNDITITNNVLKNVVSGVNTIAEDDQCGLAPYTNCHNPGSQDRWNISNNIITFFDPTIPGGFRNVVLAINGGINRLNANTPGTLKDIVFQHNTAISAASTPCWNSIYFSSNGQSMPFAVPPTNNVWILDNALCAQPNGDFGLQGPGLVNYMGNPSTSPNDFAHRLYGNVMWVQPGQKTFTYPSGNMTQTAPFTYVNPSAFDYQLLTPYWMTTSDSQLSGINNNNMPAGYIAPPDDDGGVDQ